MEWVETTGKTIQEALDAALDELGVDEQDAEYETLEEPKSGLFGKMRAEARIRARVRPTTPAAKEDRRDKRRRVSADTPREDSDAVRPVAESVASAQDAVSVIAKPRKVVAKSSKSTKPAKSVEGQAEPAKRASRSAALRSGTAEVQEGVSDGQRAPTAADRGRVVVESDGVLREVADAAEQFLRGVIDVLRLDAQLRSIVIDERTIQVEIAGSGLGFLIGPKAQTLMMLQELTRTVAHYRVGERGLRLMLDVAGYRARRKIALEEFTKGLVAEVLASGQARALEPMVASDRKVIHDYVNGIDGIASSSDGEEPDRYVVLAPS